MHPTVVDYWLSVFRALPVNLPKRSRILAIRRTGSTVYRKLLCEKSSKPTMGTCISRAFDETFPVFAAVRANDPEALARSLAADRTLINRARRQPEFPEFAVTPLFLAVSLQNLEMARAIVRRHGADINRGMVIAAQEGGTPLMRSVVANNLPMAAMLLQEGASIGSACDSAGGVLALACCETRQLAMLQLLVSFKGAMHSMPSVNSSSRRAPSSYPVHIAAAAGLLQHVQCLLDEGGYSSTELDGDGYSVVQRAAESGNVDVVRYLVHTWNTSPSEINSAGYNCLHLAACGPDCVPMLRFMVEECHVDPAVRFRSASGVDGKTALQFALLLHNPNAIAYLQSLHPDAGVAGDAVEVSVEDGVAASTGSGGAA